MMARMLRYVVLFLVCGFGGMPKASAQDMGVPVALQADVFKQVFTINKLLKDNPNLRIMVVYQTASSKKTAEQLATEFQKRGLQSRVVEAKDVLASASEFDAVYLMPGVAYIGDTGDGRKIITITGTPSYVENGKAAIGVVAIDGKPKLMVNLVRLKSEGQKISAELLKLAKIID
jgi:hypothetical protein